MKSFWTVVLGLLFLSAVCFGQVNFTPNWGKRASLNQGIDPQCKSPLETVMYIYKILLSEAQKIIDCEQLNNMDGQPFGMCVMETKLLLGWPHLALPFGTFWGPKKNPQ